MRLSILSNVLLPAPFRPMTPTTSPAGMANETSRRAQNSLPPAALASATPANDAPRPENFRARLEAARLATSRNDFEWVNPSRYRLPSPSTSTVFDMDCQSASDSLEGLSNNTLQMTSANVSSVFR